MSNHLRCNPAVMRKNLQIVEHLKRAGVDFVPIPVRSPQHRAELELQCLREIDHLEADQ